VDTNRIVFLFGEAQLLLKRRSGKKRSRRAVCM